MRYPTLLITKRAKEWKVEATVRECVTSIDSFIA
jgi:hypothetical protein